LKFLFCCCCCRRKIAYLYLNFYLSWTRMIISGPHLCDREFESKSVCMRVWKRERLCVCCKRERELEREIGCVSERERDCVFVCLWERERERVRVYVSMREIVSVRERVREGVKECVPFELRPHRVRSSYRGVYKWHCYINCTKDAPLYVNPID